MSRTLRSTLFGLLLLLTVAFCVDLAAGQAPQVYAAARAQTAARAVYTAPAAINATVPLTGPFGVYLPAIAGGAASTGFSVDIRNKASVLSLFQTYHETAPAGPVGWTGSRGACDAGVIAPAYLDSLQGLVNFFRAMAGVPAQITFRAEYNAKAQQAALMMSANGALDHEPPPSWQCYTAEGAEAAANSNLSIWSGLGPKYHGIKGQMEDDGDNNYPVGHRRWILCPATRYMGAGDVPEDGDFMAANALWVMDGNSSGPRPSVRDDFIAWPPSGYVPDDLVYARWSFMLRDADFSAATVRMRYAGGDVPLRLESQEFDICENTLVWAPNIDVSSLSPNQDHRFDVEIAGVRIGGQVRTFTYDVIVFVVN